MLFIRAQESKLGIGSGIQISHPRESGCPEETFALPLGINSHSLFSFFSLVCSLCLHTLLISFHARRMLSSWGSGGDKREKTIKLISRERQRKEKKEKEPDTNHYPAFVCCLQNIDNALRRLLCKPMTCLGQYTLISKDICALLLTKLR